MKNAFPKLAATGLLSLAMFATAAWAQTDPAPAPAAAMTASSHAQKHADAVEQRIEELHSELNITDQQSSQWDALAQTMRDNAKKIDEAFRAHTKSLKTADAAEVMTSYANLAKLHADGMQSMATAFSSLYAVLSPEQKQAADTLYRNQALKHHAAGQKSKAAAPAAAASAGGN